jgi:hypothetical protein
MCGKKAELVQIVGTTHANSRYSMFGQQATTTAHANSINNTHKQQ